MTLKAVMPNGQAVTPHLRPVDAAQQMAGQATQVKQEPQPVLTNRQFILGMPPKPTQMLRPQVLEPQPNVWQPLRQPQDQQTMPMQPIVLSPPIRPAIVSGTLLNRQA